MKVKYKEKSGKLNIVLEHQWEIDLLTALIGSTSEKIAYEFDKPSVSTIGSSDILYETYVNLENYALIRKTLSIKLEK